MNEQFNDFLQGYLECALWASIDINSDTPLDDLADTNDFDPNTLIELTKMARDFFTAQYNLLAEDCKQTTATWSRAGHDFWLTQNRHGAGYWDGYWKHGTELTEAAHVYGTVDLYWDSETNKVHTI